MITMGNVVSSAWIWIWIFNKNDIDGNHNNTSVLDCYVNDLITNSAETII